MTLLKQLIVFLTLAFTVTAAFSKNDTVVKELGENVYMVSLLHYTSLVVVGEDDVLITDTANPYRAKLLKAEIKKLTDKSVKKIVLSHEHFDHVGGTEIFPEAEIIAQANIREYEGLDPLNLVPDVIDQTFERYMSIDMGTTKVELHHLFAADGIATAIVYLPQEKVVLSADMYVDEGLGGGVFLTDTNLLGVRKVLNIILSWDVKYAINVHSSLASLAPLRRTASFLDDLYNVVLAKVKNVNDTDPSMLVPSILKLSTQLKMPKYQNWDNYNDLPIYVQKMGFSIVHGG